MPSKKRENPENIDGFLAFNPTEFAENTAEAADVYPPDGFEKSKRPKLLNNLTVPWLTPFSKDTAFNRKIDKRAPSLVKLHNEILQFCDFISPTPKELKDREEVIGHLTSVVQTLWPEATVNLFGSQYTEILTPSSDIDIAVLNVPVTSNSDVGDAMNALAAAIRSNISVSYLEVIVSARVPIIKFDHKFIDVSVDICLNNDQGLRTGKLIKDFLKDFPPLLPLILTLKTFLAQRRLNDTYSGGIGSFLLCSMIISFIQMKQRIAKYTDSTPTWNLGALLLEFLHLYGISFNSFVAGISISDGGSYFPKSALKSEQDSSSNNNNSSNRSGQLCLLNPDQPDQDVGKSSFMIGKIRRSFEHGYQLLSVALNDPQQYSYLGYIIRGDDPLLLSRHI